MENTQKNNWFDGKGTISGSAYFFRPWVMIPLAIIANIFIEEGNFGFLLLLIPVYVLNISVTNKRALAMSDKYSHAANFWICFLVPFASLYYWFADAKQYGGEGNKHNG